MSSEEPLCQGCGRPFNECNCTCPYCGETDACECCIGHDKATGG